MSTAIGDLVVNLSVNDDPFREGFAEASRSMEKFEEQAEESEGHIGGASRAFMFLGKQGKEAGEEIGGGFGEAIESLGGMTSGLGEAVHGYHALHTVIELTTSAQVMLNSVTPLGWVAIAAGAVAATAAYLHFSDGVKGATEEEKKLHEEAGKPTKPPKSAAELELEEGEKIVDEFRKKRLEMNEEGMTSGQKYAANFAFEHPEWQDAIEHAKQMGWEEDMRKARADADKEWDQAQDEHRKHIEGVAHALSEEGQGPMARLLAQAKELKENQQFLKPGEYETAMNGIARIAEAEMATKQKARDEGSAAAVEFNSAAAYETISKAMEVQESEPAKDTAANTAAMKALLEEIRDQNMKNGVLRL